MIDNWKLTYPASFADIKSKVDTIIGVETRVSPINDTRAKLQVMSANATVLGEIDIYYHNDVWKFGGLSSFLPNSWNELWRLGNEY